MFTDGSPSIATMNRFYIYGAGIPDADVVGAKFWIPASATTIPPQARVQFYLGGGYAGTPTVEKTVDITAAAGEWQYVMLDTPIDAAATGVLMSVAVTFAPEAYDDYYVYAANGRADHQRVDSPTLANFCWSDDDEASYSGANYRIPADAGTISETATLSATYGIDLIIEDNVSAGQTVYEQLVADGHDIAYIVVQL